jgi:ribosomal protein S18 acetylase RimI-like enzyme
VTDDATVHLLDELAANAVPPEVCQHIGRWRLRWAPDGRRRTCSALVPSDELALDPGELDRRLALTETFYERRAAPARVQLTDRGTGHLDALLEERGYEIEAPVTILVAGTDDLSTALARRRLISGAEVSVTERMTPQWLEAYTRLAGADRVGPRAATFDRVGPPIAFAAVAPGPGAEPASIGISVAERGWAGTFTIETDMAVRSRGLATAVMGALTAWAAGAGATRCYLQVEEGNELASAWYRRLAFSEAYRYRYRTRPLPGGTPPPGSATSC